LFRTPALRTQGASRSSTFMNAPLLPEVLRRENPGDQVELPLAADGVQRFVWEGRWGAMLIEVVGDRVSVNGQPVDAFRQA
jgi:hypothetical protein